MEKIIGMEDKQMFSNTCVFHVLEFKNNNNFKILS